MTRNTSRRSFLKATTAGGIGFYLAAGAQAQESKSALETINFACIGVGGKGESDSNDAKGNGNVVAICDVDEDTLNKASKRFKNAKTFTDYRALLSEMGDKIDAVTVSTPDHNHTAAALLAMRAGKHCFTQKPLTRTIYEARLMGETAREKMVQTQMGNQGTAESALRKAAAVVQAGALGTVSEVHVWTNRPVWPQGIDRPKEEPAVPDYLHWDEWIGPASMRPYNPIYHPFKWRGWWAFGTGALGDMACHTLNMPFAALNLRDPVSVQAETSGHNQETYPSWSVINFEFPKLGDREAVKLVWYDGGKRPPAELLEGQGASNSGALIIGEKGKIYSPGDYGGSYKALGFKEPEVEFKQSPGHFKEWVLAMKGGEPAMSNFPDYAGPLTETILLGNLAVWADGKKVEWNAKDMKILNSDDKAMAALVRPEYREGYSL